MTLVIVLVVLVALVAWVARKRHGATELKSKGAANVLALPAPGRIKDRKGDLL